MKSASSTEFGNRVYIGDSGGEIAILLESFSEQEGAELLLVSGEMLAEEELTRSLLAPPALCWRLSASEPLLSAIGWYEVSA